MNEELEPNMKFESYNLAITGFILFIMTYGFYSFVSDVIDFITHYYR